MNEQEELTAVEELNEPKKLSAVEKLNDFIFNQMGKRPTTPPARLSRTETDVAERKLAAQQKRDRKNAKRLKQAKFNV